jgi:hypothetical protein
MSLKFLAAAFALFAIITPASADVIIGSGPADTSYDGFGKAMSNATSFGEVFASPISGTLSSFTLDLTSTGGNLIGGIGVWSGGYYISNVLYTSAPTASALTNTFFPGVSVVAGTEYVAFLSVDGVSDPIIQTAMPTIDTGHPAFLDGFVLDRNGSTGDTYAKSLSWNNGANNLDAAFLATFTASAVPLNQLPLLGQLLLMGRGLRPSRLSAKGQSTPNRLINERPTYSEGKNSSERMLWHEKPRHRRAITRQRLLTLLTALPTPSMINSRAQWPRCHFVCAVGAWSNS